ncbi:MAG: ABC transporter ATP-binding protein/permease [Candidatus Bathyarchaeota archaeon]|nr:ABC transporter ATP-binding protein/permease [Candidatus Bathyarchaeota archaeon]
MSVLTRVLKFLKPYTRDAVLAMALLALVVGVDLSIPRFVQIIIDQGVASKNMSVIFQTSLIMIGASILSALLALANSVFSVRASQRFAADVRKALYHKIQSFSFGNLDSFQTGRLLVRLTSDVNQLQMMVLLGLRMLVRAPLLLIGSIAFMIATNQQLALTVLLLLPLTLILIIIFVRIAQPIFLAVQKKLETLNQILQENLAGIRVVKAFVRRDYENTRFNEANTDLMNQSFKVSRLISVLFPIMILIMNLSTVAVVYFGGLQAIAGTLTIGEIMAFINYLLSTMFPLLMLSMMAGQISAANASAERVIEIIDSTPQVQDAPDAKTITTLKGRVAFEDVSFSYDGDGSEPVLQKINLVAEPGQTVAILGATGSGKTSLIHLIPRFYDVTEGRVTIDNMDVRNITQTSLRTHIGMSLQEVILFSGTIRDNIKYGKADATEGEVLAAAKAAEAHEFIMGFPDGYDTLVGQRGVNLSGGQKQRLAIARALLVNPRILILDDSTRFVDVETEAKIHEAMEALMKDRTNFIVAQRVSTVLNADKIVVLNKGTIAAEGTHSELMQTSPIYREIYDSQLGTGGEDDE